MNSYLFTWNPSRWTWYDQKEAIVAVNSGECYQEMWSSGRRKNIDIGEKFYMMRLGVEPKGIIGCGYVITRPELLEHWNPTKAKEKKKTLRALLDFTVISSEPIISLAELEKKYPDLKWTPESGGIFIPSDYSRAICKTIETRADIKFAEYERKLKDPIKYKEGSTRLVTIKTYDRNPLARQKCIREFGYNCSVCGFKFSDMYGSVGEEYIEVHHLRPISTYKAEYEIDPVVDLRPVCANCHRMLHTQRPPLSIEELIHVVSGK
ncbi:HNH endonuclease [Vibrio parahaemolyticus]|uniref:HNH endonuclease n=2 Tax=Vibrio parahaemolyticus TaxID=670 RepID=UPI00068CA72E|nr:HNH endonuclease [Vibrio parahaemolyticus]EGR2895096.1 HNH endonuclease [Vibrio parahaemolyticus]EGR2933632.1 HNH endonuclease [Vibrio parahaemolyticus]EGR2958083.1 HNH endonuclease [Vibrio parahaemolyticus]EGR2963154.1 HNH endonuclease [Vibrio parahaemolyticus]EGR2968044.1 HNH endonuclease [Vibrio parahaemolyticus]